MRIQVEIMGHQSYSIFTGTVLSWGSTVEAFSKDRDTTYLQVPCVVLQQDDGRIFVVPLKAQYRSAQHIKALPDSSEPAALQATTED